MPTLVWIILFDGRPMHEGFFEVRDAIRAIERASYSPTQRFEEDFKWIDSLGHTYELTCVAINPVIPYQQPDYNQ